MAISARLERLLGHRLSTSWKNPSITRGCWRRSRRRRHATPPFRRNATVMPRSPNWREASRHENGATDLLPWQRFWRATRCSVGSRTAAPQCGLDSNQGDRLRSDPPPRTVLRGWILSAYWRTILLCWRGVSHRTSLGNGNYNRRRNDE